MTTAVLTLNATSLIPIAKVPSLFPDDDSSRYSCLFACLSNLQRQGFHHEHRKNCAYSRITVVVKLLVRQISRRLVIVEVETEA